MIAGQKTVSSNRYKLYSGIGVLERLLTLAILSAIMGIVSGCHRGQDSEEFTPPTVVVAHPSARRVTNFLEFTGNTAAINAVTLVARVEGYLEKIHFQDGAKVKKGDLLFTIQQSQYQAQLQQAEAQVEAQKAALWHAKTEFERYSGLLKRDAASQVDVDHWRYERDSAAASLLAAQSQVEIAKLNLSYTMVRAPFDGRMGRHLVDPGNLVGAMGQQTKLAEIEQLDPIYAYVTINERELLRILQRRNYEAREAVVKKTIPAFFGLSNEEGYPHEGRLDFASLNVTPTTGTLQLRGIFPNHDLSVLPGLFVRVRIPEAEPLDALLIPGDAVSFDQQGEYVLLANDKNIVERRGIKTGFQSGGMIVVEDGLKPSDRVIVEGLMQAIVGREVNPKPAGNSAGSAGSAAHK